MLSSSSLQPLQLQLPVLPLLLGRCGELGHPREGWAVEAWQGLRGCRQQAMNPAAALQGPVLLLAQE